MPSRHIVIAGFLFFVALVAVAPVHAQEYKSTRKGDQMKTTENSLEAARQWLRTNPPDGHNRAARRKKMAVIQAACDQLPASAYADYVECWNKDDTKANALEARYPAIFYLRHATKEAVADIMKTRVKRGLAMWYIYNMGYVFKTPETCFGIDIKTRDSKKLAEVLDFLLITHEHQDHCSPALIDAMIKAGKPVITRWKEGSTLVDKPTEFTFGSCRVKVDIGDHHNPKSQNDMLMFQIDCGDSSDRRTIYHSGDGNNFRKMTPDRPVDIFIVHVQVGMSVEAAIKHLKPRRTFVSHVLELGHNPKPPRAWRWSLDYAFDRIKNIPATEAAILTWGERWVTLGTSFQK